MVILVSIVTIFVCSLVPTLITLWLNGKVKGSVQNSFNKKLEEVKKEHSKELSEFQAELNHLKSKENFKFTKLHEKRFEVLAESYKKLAKALSMFRIYINPVKVIPPDKTADYINHMQYTNFTEAHNKFYNYFNVNKIYFDDEMEQLLDRYFIATIDIFNIYYKNEFLNKNGVGFDSETYMAAATAYKKIPELLEPIQLEIKNKFRKILGE